jgi:hypothetical protein
MSDGLSQWQGLCALFLAVQTVTGAAPPSLEARAAPASTVSQAFPANALITQRAVLTIRRRQFALNGYLARSEVGGERLILTDPLGQVLADLLVKPSGVVYVMRSSHVFRPAWIVRYIAADLKCLLGTTPVSACGIKALSSTEFLLERRSYSLQVRVVETKLGPQPPELFDETRKAAR